MMLADYYYLVFFGLSLFLAVLYVFNWHKHFDTNLSALFLLIPIVNLTLLLVYKVHDAEAAVFGYKIIYVCGCYLPWLTLMCMINLCKIAVSGIVRITSFLISTAMLFGVLTIGNSTLFYKSLTPVNIGTAWVMQKEYGPMHTVFFVFVCLYLIADFIVLFYTLFKNNQASRIVLLLLFIPTAATMVGYFLNSMFTAKGYDVLPVLYVIAQIVYLQIVHRLMLYNVSDIVIESMVQSGDTGFITIDFKYRYLGSNGTAKRILPELKKQTVDTSLIGAAGLENVVGWIDDFKKDENGEIEKDKTDINEIRKYMYSRQDPYGSGEERFYSVNVNYLYDGRKRRGYQIFLADDTQNQKYIGLLDRYNAELQDEVAAKTERIVGMHNNLILGMAVMVESRDNSTGGHIRRTSEGVRILVDEIKNDGSLELSDEFCKAMIKAAPMHDLGKIAVDDDILRKPGRFTEEEFAIMKTHAAKGAEIVHEILKDTDDDLFKRVAENMAHYHHERVDGSGYPEGLKGEEIPIEARIMAIADVYDALVSKRVYKDSFSFPEADRIIEEGMGRHFDASLKTVYEKARPNLEAYYSTE